MKRRILKCFTASAVLLCGGLISCQSENHENEMSFESFNYDAMGKVTENVSDEFPGSSFVELHGRGVLPKSIGKNDITLLRDTLMALAEVKVNDKGVITPRDCSDYTITDIKSDSTEACGSRYRDLDVVLATPSVVVWRVRTEMMDCGSLHSLHRYNFINYSINEGKILTVDNIMKKGFAPILRQLLQDKLAERPDLIVSLNEIDIPQNFRITPGGLAFIYNEYEITPYSSGLVEVEFEAYELINILTSKAFTMLTGQKLES